MHASAKYILLLCCLPALMGADVYRWVDANGVVNYAQQKPQNVASERITADTGERVEDEAPTPSAPAATPTPDGAQPPTDRLTDAQREALQGLQATDQARRDELAAIRKANCDRARGVLQRLETYGRLRVRDANGNESAMTEEDREQRVTEAQQGVVENCESDGSG